MYVVARDFAGVPLGRRSSPKLTFAEANRLAIDFVSGGGKKRCSVVLLVTGEVLVTYETGPLGSAVLAGVG